jgi:hypothetical protein
MSTLGAIQGVVVVVSDEVVVVLLNTRVRYSVANRFKHSFILIINTCSFDVAIPPSSWLEALDVAIETELMYSRVWPSGVRVKRRMSRSS